MRLFADSIYDTAIPHRIVARQDVFIASRLSRRISTVPRLHVIINILTGEGLLRFTLVALIVMCHLQPCSPEAALDVEALVRLATVQDTLVTSDLGSNEVERLDDAQPELLALLVLRDGDVLDMTHEAEAVDAVPRNCQTLLL
jgi:hypothetical protein